MNKRWLVVQAVKKIVYADERTDNRSDLRQRIQKAVDESWHPGMPLEDLVAAVRRKISNGSAGEAH